MNSRKQALTKLGIAIALLLIGVAGIWFGRKLIYSPRSVAVDQRMEVRIGVVLPLTGTTARYGTWIRNALLLKQEEHNSDPSNRFRIEYVVEDDKSEANGALSAAKKLVTVDRTPAIFGTWSSAGVLNMAPFMTEARIPLMADAISPRIRDAGEWVFRCVPDASLSLQVLIDHMRGTPGLKVAILYANNDFGVDLSAYLRRGLGGTQTPIVFDEGYPSATRDFKGTLQRVAASHPTALFVAGYAEQALVFRQAREQGLTFQFYASPSFENPDILEQAGKAADGLLYPNYFDEESNEPLMKEFLSSYQMRFDTKAEGFGASGYAGMSVLLSAIEECSPPSAECIRQVLAKRKTMSTVFGTTTMDEVGDLRYAVFLKTVRNGHFQKY